MKINAITLAAAAAAAFAAAVAWRRAHPQHDASQPGDPGVIFDAAAAAHDTVQAAAPTSTDYLRNWQDLSNAWGSDPNLWL